MKIGFDASRMTHEEHFLIFCLTLDSLGIFQEEEEKQKHFETLLLSFAGKVQ